MFSPQRRLRIFLLTQCCLVCGLSSGSKGLRQEVLAGPDACPSSAPDETDWATELIETPWWVGALSERTADCVETMIADVRGEVVLLDNKEVLTNPASQFIVHRAESIGGSVLRSIAGGWAKHNATFADVRGALAHVFGVVEGATFGDRWPEEQNIKRFFPVGGKTGSLFWSLPGTPLLLKKGVKPAEVEVLRNGFLLASLLRISEEVKSGSPPLLTAPLAVFKCGHDYYSLQQSLAGDANIGTFDLKGRFFEYARWDRQFLAMGRTTAQESVRENSCNALLANVPEKTMQSFAKSLQDNADFLSDWGLTDYSLLVRVSKAVSKTHVHPEEPLDFIQGGIVAGGYHMHMAIIDFFGPFGVSKTVERFSKQTFTKVFPMARPQDLETLRKVLSAASHNCGFTGRLAEAIEETVLRDLHKPQQQASTQAPVYYAARFRRVVLSQLAAPGEIYRTLKATGTLDD